METYDLYDEKGGSVVHEQRTPSFNFFGTMNYVYHYKSVDVLSNSAISISNSRDFVQHIILYRNFTLHELLLMSGYDCLMYNVLYLVAYLPEA
jgi:hypothetical protein